MKNYSTLDIRLEVKTEDEYEIYDKINKILMRELGDFITQYEIISVLLPENKGG